MKEYLKEDTVGRVIFIGAVVLVGVLTISAGSIFVASKVTHLKQEILRLDSAVS